MNLTDLPCAQIRALLGLAPHPEGGWYRETWRAPPGPGASRGAATAILFLLAQGECSAWHRIDATELWLWHAGDALELRTVEAQRGVTRRLGSGREPARHRAGARVAKRANHRSMVAPLLRGRPGISLRWLRARAVRVLALRIKTRSDRYMLHSTEHMLRSTE